MRETTKTKQNRITRNQEEKGKHSPGAAPEALEEPLQGQLNVLLHLLLVKLNRKKVHFERATTSDTQEEATEGRRFNKK